MRQGNKGIYMNAVPAPIPNRPRQVKGNYYSPFKDSNYINCY